MNIDFKVEGFEKLRDRIKDPRLLGRPVTKAMRQSGLAIQREMAMGAPINEGRLRGSVVSEVEQRRPFPTWVRVGPGVFYAKFVEFGTGIFGPARRRIRPVNAKALRFRGRQGIVFARSVAGMRPRPFVVPAAHAAVGTIRQIWERALRDIGDQWGRR